MVVQKSVGLMVLWLLTGGCLHPRHLADPLDRPTANTAFVAPGQNVDVSVGGARTEELVARVGVSTQLTRRAHVQANLAHAALGVLNVGSRFSLIDRDGTGLSLQAGALYTRGPWLWPTSDRVQETIRGLYVLNVPLSTTATWPIDDWALLSTTIGIDAVTVGGELQTDSVLFGGALGARRIWTRPTLHVIVGRSLLLETTVLVPVVAYGLARGGGDVVLRPGVRAGARSAQWIRIPAGPGTQWQFSVEAHAGATRIRLGASTSPILRSVGIAATPYAGVRWAL